MLEDPGTPFFFMYVAGWTTDNRAPCPAYRKLILKHSDLKLPAVTAP